MVFQKTFECLEAERFIKFLKFLSNNYQLIQKNFGPTGDGISWDERKISTGFCDFSTFL